MTSIPDGKLMRGTDRPGLGGFLAMLLGDRERYFAEVVEEVEVPAKLKDALVTLLVLCGLYGGSAGAFAGPLQALAAAVKLPLLFLGTLAICFPGFFVIQVLLGSRLKLSQVLSLVLGALALSAVVLAAVVPISVFFLLTGANYYFLTLLHVLIVLGAGLVGMVVLHAGLEFACEKRSVYPKKAMSIMRVWALLFAFVGIQMAWNLQPFVGDRGRPFQLFRHNEGNFYTAVIYSLEQLTHRAEHAPAAASPQADPGSSAEGRRMVREEFGPGPGVDTSRARGR